MLEEFVPSFIRNAKADECNVGHYSLNEFTLDELKEVTRCIKAEIESHKRRNALTKK